MIFQKIKLIEEDYIGQQIKSVVITEPAYFNAAQKSNLR
jgi:molecular chaperone DnaK (HSP70)